MGGLDKQPQVEEEQTLREAAEEKIAMLTAMLAKSGQTAALPHSPSGPVMSFAPQKRPRSLSSENGASAPPRGDAPSNEGGGDDMSNKRPKR